MDPDCRISSQDPSGPAGSKAAGLLRGLPAGDGTGEQT